MQRLTPAEARLYEALLTRGRAALAEVYRPLTVADRPIGGATLDVVLAADFALHAVLLLRHVMTTGRSLHVLTPHGFALLEPTGTVLP